MRPNEPVSAHCRTSLSRSDTDIENCRAETRGRKTPLLNKNSRSLQSETQPTCPKPREYRRFSDAGHVRDRDRSGWLGRQDSNLGMAESKSKWFALSINGHSEKSQKFGPKPTNRLAVISECRRRSHLRLCCLARGLSALAGSSHHGKAVHRTTLKDCDNRYRRSRSKALVRVVSAMRAVAAFGRRPQRRRRLLTDVNGA